MLAQADGDRQVRGREAHTRTQSTAQVVRRAQTPRRPPRAVCEAKANYRRRTTLRRMFAPSARALVASALSSCASCSCQSAVLYVFMPYKQVKDTRIKSKQIKTHLNIRRIATPKLSIHFRISTIIGNLEMRVCSHPHRQRQLGERLRHSGECCERRFAAKSRQQLLSLLQICLI